MSNAMVCPAGRFGRSGGSGALATAAVTALAAQRLGELVLSRRHEAALRRDGAVEVGARHYPVMVAMHAGWLVATLAESRANRARPTATVVLVGAGAVMAAAQTLRYWAIATLGPRWTTRIIVPPESPLMTAGPYRWLDHPNYVAVVAEIAAFPLLLRAPKTAVVFSAVNAALLTARIAAENDALGR